MLSSALFHGSSSVHCGEQGFWSPAEWLLVPDFPPSYCVTLASYCVTFLLCDLLIVWPWAAYLSSQRITLFLCEKQRRYFASKVRLVKAMVFPVVTYGWESWTYKESWVPKNWCLWTVVLEKTLESPLDCKEIQPVHPKEDQSWVFTGRIDVKTETLILWPPDAKSWVIGKDPDAGKDWGQEEKGMTEDEMVGGIKWVHLTGVLDSLNDLMCWDVYLTRGKSSLSFKPLVSTNNFLAY